MTIQEHIIKDRKLKNAAAEALLVGEHKLYAGMTFNNLADLQEYVGLARTSIDSTPIKISNDCMYQLTVVIND